MYTLKVQLLGFSRNEILTVDHQGSCIRPNNVTKFTREMEFKTESDAKTYLTDMMKLASKKIKEISRDLSKSKTKSDRVKVCMQAQYELWKETNTHGTCSVANMIFDDILNNGCRADNVYKPVDFKYFINKK